MVRGRSNRGTGVGTRRPRSDDHPISRMTPSCHQTESPTRLGSRVRMLRARRNPEVTPGGRSTPECTDGKAGCQRVVEKLPPLSGCNLSTPIGLTRSGHCTGSQPVHACGIRRLSTSTTIHADGVTANRLVCERARADPVFPLEVDELTTYSTMSTTMS